MMNGCITSRVSTEKKLCRRVTWATPQMPSYSATSRKDAAGLRDRTRRPLV
jgi:nucleotidyltransferase/DNA polymerase involved in DNA repair